MANNKVVKVPVILQMEALECGAASLAMVMAYYKKWVPLSEVRAECGVSRDGSNAFNVLEAAKRYGMECRAKAYKLESLMAKANYPAIVFWNRNHFLVVDGFKGKYAYLNDPARGRVRLPRSRRNRAEGDRATAGPRPHRVRRQDVKVRPP